MLTVGRMCVWPRLCIRLPGGESPMSRGINRCHLIVATSTLILVAVTAMAQPATPTEPEETVRVLGREFQLRPVRPEAPARPWREVKDFLPQELLAVPPTPLTDEQIRKRVKALSAQRGRQYGAEIDRLASLHLKEAQRKNPAINQETLSLDLAQDCVGGAQHPYLTASVKRLCDESNALVLLEDMLVLARTSGSKTSSGPSQKKFAEECIRCQNEAIRIGRSVGGFCPSSCAAVYATEICNRRGMNCRPGP